MMGACDHYCAVLYFHAEIEKGIFCGLWREPTLRGCVALQDKNVKIKSLICDILTAWNIIFIVMKVAILSMTT